MTHIDNPLVRADLYCPLCVNPKPVGNLVCWPCHRQEKARNDGGYSLQAERLIAEVEVELTYHRTGVQANCATCGD